MTPTKINETINHTKYSDRIRTKNNTKNEGVKINSFSIYNWALSYRYRIEPILQFPKHFWPWTPLVWPVTWATYAHFQIRWRKCLFFFNSPVTKLTFLTRLIPFCIWLTKKKYPTLEKQRTFLYAPKKSKINSQCPHGLFCVTGGNALVDDQRVYLADLLREPGAWLKLCYDLGDRTLHAVVLEKFVDPAEPVVSCDRTQI